QVYRRDITVTAAAGPASGSAAGAPLAPGIYSLDDYTMIASVDADGLDEYSVAVETNMDSAEDNVHVDEFFVRAVRVIGGEPVFYYSVPDSGSSINNLIGPEDALDCFHASAENGGVRIVWQLLDPDGGAGFTVSRSQEGGPWAPLSGDILNPREGFYVFLDDGVEPGQDYSYRVHLKTGDSSYLLFETETIRTPAVRLALFQNVPNPFNPSTEISYFLPQAESVSLDIFDVAGRRIKTLANGIMREGDHRVEWDGRDNNGSRVASGVYFYRLRAGKDTLTRKMVLLR
ncbi:MAG TPA: FlgD immunoglobulin-like domain containing protein, partial [Candidatus Krumholzibacterium sp.]|nr:FlgD immunoglobulin-like domain containing protein [Candidatus Krumholzibacterium sp.]